MVESMTGGEVVVRCASCEETRTLVLDRLEVRALGAAAMIALPPCACGAVEFLIRSEGAEPAQPGSEGHRHQLLVDHLHAEVAARGQVPASPHVIGICKPVLPAVLAQWFPEGLCLAAPVEDRR